MELDPLRDLADQLRDVDPQSDHDISQLLEAAQSCAAGGSQAVEDAFPRNGQSWEELANSYSRLFRDLASHSIVGALPSLLSLRGKPYSLIDHYPMEPMFATVCPEQMLWRCARQVSKSTCLSAWNVVRTGTTRHLQTLFITPLYPQCRKFSNNYIRPFLTDSPGFAGLIDKSRDQHVLQKTFSNGSIMHFNYCLRDADRVRGTSADVLLLDEVQDIEASLVPVVVETLSGSDIATIIMTGTPKTMDNTIEKMWNKSSQCEWVVRCTSCNHYNIASILHDLIGMIGKDTVVCAACGRPINPRPMAYPDPARQGQGFWVPAYQDRLDQFPGYHAPQPIFPMHFANPRKWGKLRDKMENLPRNVFVNEVLGEGSEAGQILVSYADLQRAALLYNGANRYAQMLLAKQNYLDVAVGIDWGGSTAPYGANRSRLLLNPELATSYTVLAVVGLRNDLRLDVLYLYKFSLVNDHTEEARACLLAWNDVDGGRGGTLFCHDYGGAGSVRETLAVHAGLPVNNVMGCNYTFSPQSHMITPRAKGGRAYYSVDKARSLAFLCTAIKSGFVGLPEYQTAKPLLEHFLALTENVIARPGGADSYHVICKPGQTDDAVHAINFAAMGLWNRHGFPNFRNLINLESVAARIVAQNNAAPYRFDDVQTDDEEE